MVSSTFSIKALATVFSVLSAANAHMIMKTPIPYGRGVINNSPLANDGSDFPCKNIFTMTDSVNDVNHLVPGVANTLSFTGSAVHGGGSCQVSLTTDLQPTKDSKWMVIKSIEGGCPANTDGNLPADPNGSGASTFEYTVPEGFPEGQYTLAWTWFNRIGNREMYMNCGRASIANSKKRYAPSKPKAAIEHRAADYPDMFKANLAIFQCKVEETYNVVFPNPGSAVQQVSGFSMKAPDNCGAAAASVAAPSAGSGASSAASSAVAATTPAVMTATTSTAAADPAPTYGFASGTDSGSQPTAGPGVFASGASSQSSAAATVAPAPTAQAPAPSAQAPAPSAQAPASTVAPVPAASTPTAGTSSGGSGSSSQGTACSNEGAWSCAADGQSFQRCASGMWSAPISMAAGTSCTPGISTNLNINVVSGGGHKRDNHNLHQRHRRAIRLSV